MAEYISKADVMAEIERLKEHFVNEHDDFERGYHNSLNAVSDSLDTLEVKEVDFGALGVLANHLIACDARGITPKYRDEELDFLEGLVEHKD